MGRSSSDASTSFRSFLDLNLLDEAVLRLILDQAKFLKLYPKKRYFDDIFLVMLFEKHSTRTRVSFEIGINQLGGRAIVLDKDFTQLGRGESIADTANVLSRYSDLLMFRGNSHKSLLELDSNADIPVINGLTDYSHPCQVLSDVFTYCEKRGDISGKRVVWMGDARNNVFHSWVHISEILDFELRVASPEEFAPDEGKLVNYIDPMQAVEGADLITTDCWVSMGDKNADFRHKVLGPYQVNAKLFEKAKEDALFMHCLPAHRGLEVTDEVIDGEHSCVFDEAENRLHVQKAIMLWCLGLL